MTPANDDSNLTRAINPMPHDVHDALISRDLMAAYEARPAYQRNDYLGWLARAKRSETRARRLNQMLEELATGGVYMRMRHRPGIDAPVACHTT